MLPFVSRLLNGYPEKLPLRFKLRFSAGLLVEKLSWQYELNGCGESFNRVLILSQTLIMQNSPLRADGAEHITGGVYSTLSPPAANQKALSKIPGQTAVGQSFRFRL
jgi:hypothetical protein